MASKVKEKSQILSEDEIKYHELLANFKKTLNIWFSYGAFDDTILKEVLNSCIEIILHGLKNGQDKMQTNANNDSPLLKSSAFIYTENKNNYNNSDLNINLENKIIDDFKWVRNAVNIKSSFADTSITTKAIKREGVTSTITPTSSSQLIQKQILLSKTSSNVAQWLRNNLNEHNICSFLQYLLFDKELLEEHYSEEALLRQEKYVTTLVIGLAAFETHNYGLLTQFDTILQTDKKGAKHHNRSNSQPNVIVLCKRKANSNAKEQHLEKSNLLSTLRPQHSSAVLLTIRKTKSLPEFTSFEDKSTGDVDGCIRPRCKTTGVIKKRKTQPQNVPQHDPDIIASSSGFFLCDDNDNQPTTSQTSSNLSKSSSSNYTLNSTISNTPNSMSTSESFSNLNTTKCIHLINTDNIKIWTDHSWELKQKKEQEQQQQLLTVPCAIPTPLITSTKSSKSLSPINNFFSLFSTPPSYTSWFIDPDSPTLHESTETAIESIMPDNNDSHNNCHSVISAQQQSPLSLSSTVFDKFLPIDGKKLRSRKSQNIFEDVNSTLDYSSVNVVSTDTNTEVSSTIPSHGSVIIPKYCQSLTRFLQMSHMSHNNTELEKENAHFRISEAIISAIEHIKWNKFETQRNNHCREVTPLATDCLASSEHAQNSVVVPTISNDIIEAEHVPYAELEEVSYDLLSAEVVGLSLISKFDEKHLPKVSELKWLVSDDDTPQKLLPMPDLTSSANPDEHVIHSATRGTRYWAPPRQQIIFTDHPPPNRKELLKKQNYRCAGCGMRVSPQYMQSFRYCTYLGKYNCTGCHRNQISVTPARILQAWDFKCYPVSVFAYRLLEQMYTYPLFYVPDLNPALYFRSKSLLSARKKRLQLKFVKDFIRTCRFALRQQTFFEFVPDYITSDIDIWSMSDFIDARTKCLQRSIDELINKCENHILNCVLCTARGFLCEYCHADVVIYPWDLRVERCDRCGTCFHRNCWKSMNEVCRRCQRINKRQDEIRDVM